MKENFEIYLSHQFCWRDDLVDQDSQLSHKKMKTMFLGNMSKSFFLIIIETKPVKGIKNRHVRFLVADTRLHLAVSVGRSVGLSVIHIFKFRVVFALAPTQLSATVLPCIRPCFFLAMVKSAMQCKKYSLFQCFEALNYFLGANPFIHSLYLFFFCSFFFTHF